MSNEFTALKQTLQKQLRSALADIEYHRDKMDQATRELEQVSRALEELEQAPPRSPMLQ